MIFSFLLKGDFAHFKQHLSFKSRTTYLAPLKTELIGILLNVIGEYRKFTDVVNEYLDKVETGVYIKNIGGVVFDSANLRKMPKSFSKLDRVRTFYKIEVLFNVEYLVFYKIKDEKIEERLRSTLESGYKGVPFLGISDFLADVVPLNLEVREDVSNTLFNSYIQEHLVESLHPEKDAMVRNQRVMFEGKLQRFVFFYKAKVKLKEKIKTFKFYLNGEEREVPVF